MFYIKKQIKLQTKITLLVIAIVFISIFTAMVFTSRWSINNIKREVEKNMMNTAQMVSKAPNVIEGLKFKNDENIIQPYIRSVLNSTSEIDLIVVADMQGIRYSHPVEERIGRKVVGGDDIRAIEKGESYISVATGTLGRSVRAFAPIFDEKGEQLGYVLAGTLTQSIDKTKEQILSTVFISSFIGLVLGSVGAFFLSQNVKSVLLGLEPGEISKMYIEKRSILDNIHEGIIAIDKKSKITLINDSALEILGIKGKSVIGKDVEEIVPNTRLKYVLDTGIAEYDREQVLNQTVIITNRVPIHDGAKIVGAIATFRDKTIMMGLAEELTGVKQIVDGLRANTHEFMNKLHVISGLIELGELDEAKKYIVNVGNNQAQIMSLIINKIKDPTVAGLMIGKLSRAKELGINMIIDQESLLNKRNHKINSNRLLTIIGNLLENAIDAVNLKQDGFKQIHVKIKEDENKIEIIVNDTGTGIKDEDVNFIFERGFSTKEGNRGIGLALIKETVENLKGSIKITSNGSKGTEFMVNIPKEENND